MKNNRNDVVLHQRRRIASLNAIHPSLKQRAMRKYIRESKPCRRRWDVFGMAFVYFMGFSF